MKFILVVTDEFSRFTWMVPSVTKDTIALAKHLLSLFCTFGFPNAIKSDQAYFSKVVEAVNASGQVAHCGVIAFNHHANGIAERVNRSAQDVIFKLAKDSIGVDYWDQFVYPAMLYLNVKIHSAVKSAPFALMFGRSAFFQGGEGSDIENVPQNKVSNHMKIFWDNYKEVVIPRINKFREQAQQKTKKNYRKKLATYNVGDIVDWMIPNPKRKGDDRYKGPFEVVEVCDNNMYEIKSETDSFHAPANFLKSSSLKKDGRLYHEEIDEVAEASEVSREPELTRVIKKTRSTRKGKSMPTEESTRKSTRARRPTQRLITQ